MIQLQIPYLSSIIFATLLDMAIAEQHSTTSDAALARKHRIAMRNRQRSTSNVSQSSSENETSNNEARSNKRPRVSLEDEAEPLTVSSSDSAIKSKDIAESIIRKKKPHITGIKKQSRYDPGVVMTKVELKAWRKEARRVRNRESAAASRMKNREAINKFEVEVKEVQKKYDAALQYILDLEDKLRRSGSSSSAFYPSEVLRQDLDEIGTVSPPQSPTPTRPLTLGICKEDEFSLEGKQDQVRRPWPVQFQNDLDKNTLYHTFSRHHPNHLHILNPQKHIIDNTIIRPIACV